MTGRLKESMNMMLNTNDCHPRACSRAQETKFTAGFGFCCSSTSTLNHSPDFIQVIVYRIQPWHSAFV